jgi:hypothetical protein
MAEDVFPLLVIHPNGSSLGREPVPPPVIRLHPLISDPDGSHPLGQLL